MIDNKKFHYNSIRKILTVDGNAVDARLHILMMMDNQEIPKNINAIIFHDDIDHLYVGFHLILYIAGPSNVKDQPVRSFSDILNQ